MPAEDFESLALTALGTTAEEAPAARWAAAYRALSSALTVRREAGPSAPKDPERAILGLIYGPRTFGLAEALLAAYPPGPGGLTEVGAGFGPFGFAAARSGAGPIVLRDLDDEVLRKAAALFEAGAVPTPRLEAGDARAVRAADNLAACFVLNELVQGAPDPAARATAQVERWLAALPLSGLLYLIEPGTLPSARVLQSVRDHFAPAGLVRAPCTHAAPCPRLDRPDDWCHFTWPVRLGPLAQQIADRAGRNHQEQHFSWLILSPTPAPAPGGARLLESRRQGKRRELRVCRAEGETKLVDLGRSRDENAALDALRPGAVLELDTAALVEKGDGLRLAAGAWRTLRPL